MRDEPNIRILLKLSPPKQDGLHAVAKQMTSFNLMAGKNKQQEIAISPVPIHMQSNHG